MSKHRRLDAIERRLAYLEANQAGEEQDRDPRYSCTPTEFDGPPPFKVSWRDGAPYAERIDPADLDAVAESLPLGTAARAIADDVRERLSERTSVADAAGEHDTWLRKCGVPIEQWDERARRYEASLLALLPMLEWNAMLRAGDAARHLANLHSLVAGCIEGGTITPDGWLQRDE